MPHLLQLVVELALLTLLLGYKDNANNSFNDLFLSNIELTQPCEKIVFKVESMYSKGICFFNMLLGSGRLGLYLIMSLTFLFTWHFRLVDFCLACCLNKVETCPKCLLTIDGL